jgi:hypothetical protein
MEIILEFLPHLPKATGPWMCWMVVRYARIGAVVSLIHASRTPAKKTSNLWNCWRARRTDCLRDGHRHGHTMYSKGLGVEMSWAQGIIEPAGSHLDYMAILFRDHLKIHWCQKIINSFGVLNCDLASMIFFPLVFCTWTKGVLYHTAYYFPHYFPGVARPRPTPSHLSIMTHLLYMPFLNQLRYATCDQQCEVNR